MPINKVVPSFTEAVADIDNGATLMIDGFGGPGGMAQNLLIALRDLGVKDLTIICNTAGIASSTGFGTVPGDTPIDAGILIENNQVKKVIASYPVSPSPSRPNAFEKAYNLDKISLEVVPQGTLAERIRSGGAGIPAFYTPSGVGTLLEEGKEIRSFNKKDFLLEHALPADFALLKGQQADTLGNVIYEGTSRNLNAVMATAANITIIEVEKIVEPGSLNGESIHTPAIYVNRIVQPSTLLT